MTNISELRIVARAIFDKVVLGLAPDDAVRRAVQLSGSHFSVCDIPLTAKPIYAIAIGKAALSMSEALERSLGQFFSGGVLVGPAPNLAQAEWLSRSRWNWYVGGHPLPNRESLAAAADAVGLLQRANKERALMLFLISGGGSAMLEWPATRDISLAELQEANRVLVTCGASISEINSVRRAFSAIKGGKLAARAPVCDQITLIISDVPTGEEFNVASGPTIKPETDPHDAREVAARYQLRSQLPVEIVKAIDSPREFQNNSDAMREHFVLLKNEDALRIAANTAEELGHHVEIGRDINDQEVTRGCEQLSDRLQQLRRQKQDESPVCLISGGEFACPVTGDGVGGRNLETALRLAILNQSRPTEFVAVCAGTDGIDGNSPAAGAIVDSTTIDRAKARGLDAGNYLERSDAYSFFAALGDAIITGPTGTNVRDLRILLAG
jgi:glycerate 2-kinase